MNHPKKQIDNRKDTSYKNFDRNSEYKSIVQYKKPPSLTSDKQPINGCDLYSRDCISKVMYHDQASPSPSYPQFLSPRALTSHKHLMFDNSILMRLSISISHIFYFLLQELYASKYFSSILVDLKS